MKKQLFIFILALLMVCSSFTACGEDATIEGIIMKTQPTKTEYLVGDTFDPAGATVELTYSDGKTETKALTADMLPVSLTFTEAGYHQIPVIYSVGGITKTTIIVIKVSDPSTSGQLTGLAAAQTDATAILTAYYNGLVFVAPENYPAAPEKLATDAKAVFDAAIAAFQTAGDSAEVYDILGKAQADLNALDNYIDWYAAEKVAEIEETFELEYTANKTFIENYNDKFVVMKRQIARILRSDSLAEIDALVESLDTELENAENFLDDLVEMILKFDWKLDLSTDPENDDANLTNYYDIEDALESVGMTDMLYQLELVSRLAKVDKEVVELLAPSAGIDAEYKAEVLDDLYNDTFATYDLYTALSIVSSRMDDLLCAREEADMVGGIEDIIDEAMDGYEYGDIAANSDRHQALKDAWTAFENWKDLYDIDAINEDLVDNAADLAELLEILDDITAAYEDGASLTHEITGIPAQIILDNADVKAALATGKAVADDFTADYSIPAWGSIMVDDDNDPSTPDVQVYLIKGYDDYACADRRYVELEAAKAEVAEEGGLVSLIDAIATPVVYNKTNAQIDPAWAAYLTLKADYLLDFANDNFIFKSMTREEAQTEATALANLQAILGKSGEIVRDTKLNDAKARYAVLTNAYTNAFATGNLVEQINTNIGTADLATNLVTLDSKTMLDGVTATYNAWKTNYAIDEANDGTVILGDAYTTYKAGIDEYKALTDKVTEVKTLIAAVQLPISENSSVNLNKARAAFDALAAANSDASANKQTTYKHLDSEYKALCDKEAGLFAIRYASLIQATYEGQLKDLRDDYTALIGGETLRADDNTRLGKALATALTNLHALENTYSVAALSNAIYTNGNSPEWNVAADEKVEGVTYLYDVVVKATDDLCAAEENNFKLAARYIVTKADSAYTLTIYAAGAYNAADILDAEGLSVASYKTIVVDALVGDGIVTLTGFTADEVVFGTATATALLADVPTIVVKGAEIDVLTLNAPAIVVVEDDTDATAIGKIVANAATTIDANGAGAIEVEANKAQVTIDAVSDVKLTTNAPANVTTTGYANVTTTADITVKADTIDALIKLPEVAEGETADVPEVTLNATGKVSAGLASGVVTDNITSGSGEIELKEYIGDNFGEGDNGDSDEGWTDIYE